VYDQPGFADFYYQATPIREISRLRLGSRPARRKGNTNSIEELRAIPWVFAWTQSRFLLPAWYGCASAIHDDDYALLREMYDQWPFFRNVVMNIETALAIADMNIARYYVDQLCDKKLADKFLPQIEAEYKSAIDAVLKITGQSELLEKNLVLQRSIAIRNPYVDPLSYLQVRYIKELRAQNLEAQSAADQPGKPVVAQPLLDAVLMSINGVAAGLQSTG
jgi:phosphoenolpyruvate carboxylase